MGKGHRGRPYQGGVGAARRVTPDQEETAMESQGKAQPAHYAIKQVETVVSSPQVRARIFTLAPGEKIPWHHHTEITDHYFVLRGRLAIATRQPDQQCTLGAGDRYQIKPGTAHCHSNPEAVDCEFLLLQGTGTYDWIGDQD
jgi:mannose-6-phosphate isomerase-like protein (cupin superfamily)